MFDPEVARKQIISTIKHKTSLWVHDDNSVQFTIDRKNRDGYVYKVVVEYNEREDLYNVYLYRYYDGSPMLPNGELVEDWGVSYVADKIMRDMYDDDLGEKISWMYDNRKKYQWEVA